MRVCNLLVIFSFFFSNCSAAYYDKYDGFWNWMIDRPTQYEDSMLEPVDGKIVGDRHPYYLGFLTPDIIFNPQGGIYYPDMIVKVLVKDNLGKSHFKFYNTADLPNVTDEYIRGQILKARFSIFKIRHAALVEFIVPYREIAVAIYGDEEDPEYYGNIFCGNLFFILAIPRFIGTVIIYPIHDVIKTIMLPVAGVYYTVQAFEDDEEEE